MIQVDEARRRAARHRPAVHRRMTEAKRSGGIQARV
jgi:hypothetical protein